MKRNERGITLIALIITVIILLILAGTAISIAVNGDSLFGKASQARESWNSSVIGEETTINENILILENMLKIEPTILEGWDENKVSSVVEGDIIVDGQIRRVKAPIPTGYIASDIATEDEISEGLVIYQGTEKVSDDIDAITTRNQFVWIPVYDINSMVMCKNNAEASVCNIILEDGELKCTTHITSGATNICGRLYGEASTSSSTSSPYIYSTSMNFNNVFQTFADNYGSREPAVVTGNNTGNGTSQDGHISYHGLASATAFLTQLQGDFYDMAKSVALYKGFYIGRYEAGYSSSTYTSKKGQIVMNATTTANVGANKWYGLYNHLRTTMGILNSQMIWGCQYDQAIKFIKQNKGSLELDPEIGHSNIGLKLNVDISGAEGVNDIMKNIYDLEGNYSEWTEQAENYYDRKCRGGSSADAFAWGDYKPASDASGSCSPDSANSFASRAALYL